MIRARPIDQPRGRHAIAYRHFVEHAWNARDTGDPPRSRVSDRIVAENRATFLQLAAMWRERARAGDKVALNERYEELLSAFRNRGIWP